MRLTSATITALALIAWTAPAGGQTPAAAQNPSPMVEETRAHERLVKRGLRGTGRSFARPGGRPVELLVPDAARRRAVVDIVVHFHGAAWLPQQAVLAAHRRTVVAVVNLGAGSGIYHRTFAEPAAFDSLLAGVAAEVSAVAGRDVRPGRVTLAGFSAGHGAVRAILREPRHFARVDAVLLLDGMHTSYVPEGAPLAAGGTLDTTNLAAFAAFARAAMRGEKRFIVTHSEIFPGTYASTTETADWLLRALGLRRTPRLRWGPRGMQQLSEVRAGRFQAWATRGTRPRTTSTTSTRCRSSSPACSDGEAHGAAGATMSARARAEAGLILSYILAVPFVVFLAGMVQIFVLDAAWGPGVPHWLELLSGTLPAALTGAVSFMMLRLAAEDYMSNASLARWPVRAAPVLIGAGWLTGMGLMMLAEGHRALNGLMVLPTLALWGGAVGEWLAHRWLARGPGAMLLIRRFLLAATAATAWLVIAAWFLRFTPAELDVVRRKCKASYADDRTAADSAKTDAWSPTVNGRPGPGTCAPPPRRPPPRR